MLTWPKSPPPMHFLLYIIHLKGDYSNHHHHHSDTEIVRTDRITYNSPLSGLLYTRGGRKSIDSTSLTPPPPPAMTTKPYVEIKFIRFQLLFRVDFSIGYDSHYHTHKIFLFCKIERGLVICPLVLSKKCHLSICSFAISASKHARCVLSIGKWTDIDTRCSI